MKKIFLMTAAVCMALSFSACGDDSSSDAGYLADEGVIYNKSSSSKKTASSSSVSQSSSSQKTATSSSSTK